MSDAVADTNNTTASGTSVAHNDSREPLVNLIKIPPEVTHSCMSLFPCARSMDIMILQPIHIGFLYGKI